MNNNENLFPLKDKEVAFIVDSSIDLDLYKESFTNYVSQINWEKYKYVVAILHGDFHFIPFCEQDFEIANHEGFSEIYSYIPEWKNVHPYEALMMLHYKNQADKIFETINHSYETVIYTTKVYAHSMN